MSPLLSPLRRVGCFGALGRAATPRARAGLTLAKAPAIPLDDQPAPARAAA